MALSSTPKLSEINTELGTTNQRLSICVENAGETGVWDRQSNFAGYSNIQTISINPDWILFTAQGIQSETITVTASAPWSIDSSTIPTWLTISNVTSTTFEVVPDDSGGNAQREVNITIWISAQHTTFTLLNVEQSEDDSNFAIKGDKLETFKDIYDKFKQNFVDNQITLVGSALYKGLGLLPEDYLIKDLDFVVDINTDYGLLARSIHEFLKDYHGNATIENRQINNILVYIIRSEFITIELFIVNFSNYTHSVWKVTPTRHVIYLGIQQSIDATKRLLAAYDAAGKDKNSPRYKKMQSRLDMLLKEKEKE